MNKTSEAKLASNKRWSDKNKEKRNMYAARSGAKTYIRNYSTCEDMQELNQLFLEKIAPIKAAIEETLAYTEYILYNPTLENAGEREENMVITISENTVINCDMLLDVLNHHYLRHGYNGIVYYSNNLNTIVSALKTAYIHGKDKEERNAILAALNECDTEPLS